MHNNQLSLGETETLQIAKTRVVKKEKQRQQGDRKRQHRARNHKIGETLFKYTVPGATSNPGRWWEPS